MDATVAIPGSKSITARALYLAAVGEAPSLVTGALEARDTRLFADALEVMGARIEDAGDGALRVTPMSLPPRGGRIECGLAGTVMRFLPPLAALSAEETLFDGDKQAYARPLGPLLDALVRMGASVTYHGERGHLPFSIRGPLRTPLGAQAWVDASSSSQFLSALLLVSPLVGDPLFVSAPGPVPSMPHVEMTLASLAGAGIDLEVVDEAQADLSTWHVFPSRPRGGEIVVEPDLSNAGPFLAAAMITGGRVRIPAWPGATTQAGDAWRALLGHMGATITLDEEGLTLTGPGAGNYPGIKATMAEVGELTPTLAAICAYASTPSHLSGIAHLRGHETDRLAALVAEINRAGGQAEETEDGLVITPRPLHAAQIRSYADHRMATFGAILGLITPGITVDDITCTSKTLPGFAAMWDSLLSADGTGTARDTRASSPLEEK
ncbi:3-phosphoshikimate 1-carboxyvinyltransferase [Actinomyces sp. oral taxon 180]|uniref:3-phosphoshikimate 1-carboxyvinyltransferase n=1 Tax=Actinomyces sp. oral taxon 180 TaxID=651609 RepID=UPI0006806DB0|nr:3-phosphoshikimate 1-carboxyvinyltransferase [Actinomyces sp. oral taxon 180]